ncbi:hypothetical protein [Actinophytocola sp.]|uniref:hypothetical protein n=1 Tax=Actinophytocola sp. TaxID=1872138 RepID=UPI003D6B6997
MNREVESYDVTVRSLDHDGKPTPEYFLRFVDIDERKAYVPYDESGTVVARVPKGRYYLDGFVQTQRGENAWPSTEFAEANHVVDGDAELVLDARRGKQVDFTVDEPNAEEGATVLQFAMRTEWGSTGSTLIGAGFDDLFVAPSRTSGEGFTFMVEAELAEPDGSGGQWGFHGSPYMYHLRWHQDGRVPEKLARTVRNKQLAKAVTEHAVSEPGLLGMRSGFLTGDLPFRLTEYYTPGEPWYDTFEETADPQDLPVTFQTTATGREYRKGEVTRQRWNVGVFGPAFPVSDFDPATYAGRLGDEVRMALPLFADQAADHDGFSFGASGTTELLRDGRPVGSSDFPGGGDFVLPADTGTYTLRTTAERDAPLSTSVSGEWTFSSSHVDGEEPAALPLLAVRFAPALDDANTAPAGRFQFPVYVQRNGSATPGRIQKPTVEVSYDDGTTWAPVRLSWHDGRWLATVD